MIFFREVIFEKDMLSRQIFMPWQQNIRHCAIIQLIDHRKTSLCIWSRVAWNGPNLRHTR